jgi:hypothetical protein
VAGSSEKDVGEALLSGKLPVIDQGLAINIYPFSNGNSYLKSNNFIEF